MIKLCEKLPIARANNSTCLLNKHNKLVSKCHHMNKFTLKHFKNNVIFIILFLNVCSFHFRYKAKLAEHLMIG